MLYALAQFREIWFPVNVFQYITFRSGGAFLTSLLIMLVFGQKFIDLVKRWEVTQTIREYGPQTHLKKAGTPTMGGLLILMALVISTLLWARLNNRFIVITLLSAVYLGALGFLDDYKKMILKHPSKGLSQTGKIFFQMLWAVVITGYFYLYPSHDKYSTVVQVPYLKYVFVNLESFIILFGIVVVVGASNAVNLTDGLDGLACGTLLISALAYGIFAYLAGHAKLSSYLRLIPVAGAGELSIYLAAMAGACLGFLWFNGYPAAIFMGDTGSLFLGGTIGLVALAIKQELLLIIVGGIFVAEAASVLLQIGSIKIFKRRIFKMSPLHHHFEMLGWPETKVTLRFWIVAVVLALIAMTSLKLR
ncbi:MAG: Phospho-N-acetylmuramoyl-pentapeptide-transferase [Elusimicrobia bacterium]|nr:Phospho-N-acetylmuramoyl-pentapeptide-transferase [Elusimicrobiota bacterium]